MCACGVCGVWVVVLWWCVCVVCGEAWHVLSLSLALSPSSSLSLSLSLFFLSPFSFSFSFSFSLAASLTLALALVLSLFLLSSLLATKHCGKNRSSNTAANIEAFECDLAQGKCTAVGSLHPPLPSLLPSSPSPPQKKKEETFHYRSISGEEFIFITVLNKFQKIAAGENYSHYSFILIQKQKGCNCNDFVEDGIDQHLQIPIVSSIHQRRGFSFRRYQRRDFASEDHSVAVCHQHRHRQSRFIPIEDFELHLGCALDRRHVHLDHALSIFIFTV